MRIFIEDIRYGVTEGGIACGPVPDIETISVCFVRDGERMWLSNSDAMGMPNFYLSKEDIFSLLTDSDLDDKSIEHLNSMYIDRIGDFDLTDYCQMMRQLDSGHDKDHYPLIRLMMALGGCYGEGFDALADDVKGKYADEITVPDVYLESWRDMVRIQDRMKEVR